MLKRSTSLVVALFCTFSSYAQHSGVYQQLWQNTGQSQQPAAGEQRIFPSVFQQFYTNESQLEQSLLTAGADYEHATEIALPTPDGDYRLFRVWRNETMSPELQAAYPMIHTWTAEDISNPRITAQLDYTLFGFHAMVFENGSTWFIDPLTNQKTGYYLSYHRKDYSKPLNQRMYCGQDGSAQELTGEEPLTVTQEELPAIQFKTNGTSRRNYRLALACTYEYSTAVTGSVTPTKAGVISAITTSVNRVNGIYNRELTVNMTLIDITDIVYITSEDPYTNNNGPAMLGQNQTNLTNVIGSANYDIGHVFSTGGGGIASLGAVCSPSNKARGVTGSPFPVGDAFDVDYVAHEMGHQFRGDHTFNNDQTGACSGNMSSSSAYEPGSASTIMGYAGICGSDNLQDHSDAYFHARNLDQMSSFITTGGGSGCATVTPSTNTPPVVPAFTASYNIPASTPFELTAPTATDATNDTLTYTWEMYNLGNTGATWASTMTAGPIFRSYPGTTSPTRVFPTINKLVANAYPYVGEKLPTVTRNMRFKLTVRDIYQGWGSFNLPDDTIGLAVTSTAGPFLVNVPNTAVIWTANTSQVVQWSVANTDLPPVSASHVNIYLSVDGGFTYPYLLKANTPNDGEETITVPNVNAMQARIKVKGAENVFFDISNVNFKIEGGTGVAQVAWANQVQVFPVPASKTVSVDAGSMDLQGRVSNAMGQVIWQGAVQGKTTLNISAWASGVYYLKLSDNKGGQLVKTIVVQ